MTPTPPLHPSPSPLPSRKEGPLPVEEVAKELVSTTLRVDGNISFLKYCLNIILKQFSKPDSPNRIFHFSTAAKTLEDIRCVVVVVVVVVAVVVDTFVL